MGIKALAAEKQEYRKEQLYYERERCKFRTGACQRPGQ